MTSATMATCSGCKIKVAAPAANGNDTAKISQAWAAAMAKGCGILLGPGTYNYFGSLQSLTAGRRQGLQLSGCGFEATKLRVAAPAGSFAIDLGKSDLYQFDMGARFSDMTLAAHPSNQGGGVVVDGQYGMAMENFSITGFIGDGLKIREKFSPTSPDPDGWSTAYWYSRNLSITHNGGWGINDESALVWIGRNVNIVVIGNSGGGVSVSGTGLVFDQGSIAYNGRTANGGIRVTGRPGFTPAALRFFMIEIDGNYRYNELLEAGTDVAFDSCRDLAFVDGAVERAQPLIHLNPNAGMTVTNARWTNHRYRAALAHNPFEIMDLHNSSSVNNIKWSDGVAVSGITGPATFVNKHPLTTVSWV